MVIIKYSQSQTNKMFSPPTTVQFLTVQFPAIITAMWFILRHGMYGFIHTSQSTFLRKMSIANLPLNQRDLRTYSLHLPLNQRDLRTYSLYVMKHDEETFKQAETQTGRVHSAIP